jgi:hypothetical protein
VRAQADAKLVHSLDIIASFGQLNVEVPHTAARVPAALQTIAARKCARSLFWLHSSRIRLSMHAGNRGEPVHPPASPESASQRDGLSVALLEN